MTETTTQPLRSTGVKSTAMEDTDIAHLAGVMDAGGAITVHITKSERYSIGYQFKPTIRIHRPEDDEMLLGKLDAYCEEHTVRHDIKEKSNKRSNTLVFEIFDHDSIRRFLEPMMPYLVSTYYDAAVMLDEILPAVKEGKHRTKEGMFDLLDYADELRSQGRQGATPKYTKDHFAQEWAGELSA